MAPPDLFSEGSLWLPAAWGEWLWGPRGPSERRLPAWETHGWGQTVKAGLRGLGRGLDVGMRQRGVIWLAPSALGPETLFLGTLCTMGASILRRHGVQVDTGVSVFLSGIKVNEESQTVRWFLQPGVCSIYSSTKLTRV